MRIDKKTVGKKAWR